MKLRRCDDCPSDVDVDLLDRLKDWRRSAAKEQQVPAYVVFTDATLTAIAEQRPADPSALVSIPGIGASKLDRYGQAVLALVAEGDDWSFHLWISALLRCGADPQDTRWANSSVNRLCAPDGGAYCLGPRDRIRASEPPDLLEEVPRWSTRCRP